MIMSETKTTMRLFKIIHFFSNFRSKVELELEFESLRVTCNDYLVISGTVTLI